MEPIAAPATSAPAPTASMPPPPLSVVAAPPAEPAHAGPSLNDARLYINREISCLAFNERVLEEACDPLVPALERFKFLAIFSSNLDEFFMIRVAGLKQQLSGHVEETGPDAMSPSEQLSQIAARTHELVARQYRVLTSEVVPIVEKAGVRILSREKLAEKDAFLSEYFQREVFPVLTPIAIDPGHPFPHLRNKSLNLAVRFGTQTAARLHYGVVPVPAGDDESKARH